MSKIYVTGATGELGGLVIRHLLNQVPADQITAIVRNLDKAAPLAELGIGLRHGDYSLPETLTAAFAGADRLLFISSPDADDTLRVVQHANVVKAARDAGVKHIAYTGYAFAEQSIVPLAQVHLATEHMIRTTRIPYTFLRNSLYTEVFVNPSLGAAVSNGAIVTNAGSGKLNTVSRSDLALAAAAVLAGEGHENQVYTLVSREPWSFDELARLTAEVSGKPVAHRAVSMEEHHGILLGAGLPEPVAQLITGIHHAVSAGETSRTSDDLERLIGKLAPLAEAVKQALRS